MSATKSFVWFSNGGIFLDGWNFLIHSINSIKCILFKTWASKQKHMIKWQKIMIMKCFINIFDEKWLMRHFSTNYTTLQNMDSVFFGI